MAIATEINNLKTNISNAYTSIQTKGGTIPTNKNTENLSNAIDSISSGGDVSEYFNSTVKGGNNNLGGNNWTSVIKKLPALSLVNGSTNMSNMFYGFKGESLDLSNLDTSNVTNMDYLFSECSKLTSVNLSSFDTSKVTSMRVMFSGCGSLTSLNLSSFDTSKVTSMRVMFSGCGSLTSLDLSNFNTSNVTSMDSLFSGCGSLTSLNLSSFNTSNVTSMTNMFNNCRVIETLPKLNASKVININNMFNLCQKLKNFGGLENIGQSFSTSASANYISYKYSLYHSTDLTEQSIINVLNNLYDIATKGCNTQQVVLGSTNLAKLTSEAGQQALQTATERGWSIS